MIKGNLSNFQIFAKSLEDLKVISAYLQDSIIIIKDIVFLKKNRIFIMVVNRFMWEDLDKGLQKKNRRIRCAIKFEQVISVKSQNINQKKGSKSLECLAIKCSKTLKNTYKIIFFFSGNGMITLNSEIIEVVMEDLGKSWNVKYIPDHKI